VRKKKKRKRKEDEGGGDEEGERTKELKEEKRVNGWREKCGSDESYC
jgi:hypothetical protein